MKKTVLNFLHIFHQAKTGHAMRFSKEACPNEKRLGTRTFSSLKRNGAFLVRARQVFRWEKPSADASVKPHGMAGYLTGMKNGIYLKIVLFTLVSFLFGVSFGFVGFANTENWYEYNDYSGSHSFSLRFPRDWKVKTLGANKVGFLQGREINGEPSLVIQRFEGNTYNEVISFYRNPSRNFVREHDFWLELKEENVIAKKAYFKDKELENSTERTMIKRGSTIVSIEIRGGRYEETAAAIMETFRFTDNWKCHIDFKDSYTFITPEDYSVRKTREAVVIKNMAGNKVFVIEKHEDTTVEKAQRMDIEEGDRIIERGNSVFILRDMAGTVVNFEIGESFEFFDLPSTSTYPFRNFTDVRDNHPNAAAINKLAERKIVTGYEDGTFRPGNPVNRGELSKMIVPPSITFMLNRNIFRNCFEDVNEEWFARYVCFSKAMGWVKGQEDGYFYPAETVSKKEGTKVMSRLSSSEKTIGFEISEEEEKENFTREDVAEMLYIIRY